MPIKVKCLAGEVPVTFLTFPGGERHVRVSHVPDDSLVEIECIFQSSQDIIDLMLVNDAVRRLRPLGVHLLMRYMPFARQDRVAVAGEAHSMYVMAQLIKGCKFDSITVWDPHSDVVEALFADQNLHIMPQHYLTNPSISVSAALGNLVLVSPDAGALKKIHKINDYRHVALPVVCAEKMRDVATGKISGTKIDLSGYGADTSYLMVDDIADGGGTFLTLAAEMRRQGATKIALYVTHGIFSKGLDVFKGLIDEVHCPNVLNDAVAGQFVDGYYKVV